MAYWPDTGTGTPTDPGTTAVVDAVRQFFTEGGAGVAPSVPGAEWFNMITDEVLAVLAAAGIAPDKASHTQLLAAIQNIALASPIFTGTPAAPTPAQFDNDRSVATTEFVQRALGSFSGEMVVSATTNLTVADVGKIIKATNAVPASLILPILSSCFPGTSFMITHSGSSALYVIPTAPDTLRRQNDVVTEIIVPPGCTMLVTAVSGSWEALANDAILATSTLFSASFAVNGHQKLPSGLIIQWGRAAPTTTSTSFVFPIAFPNGVLHIGEHDTNSAVTYPMQKSHFALVNITLTGGSAVNIGALIQPSAGGAPALAASVSASCAWFAIGY